MTTDGTGRAGQYNSPGNNGGPAGSGDKYGREHSPQQNGTQQDGTQQDNGNRLIKLVVAIALLLVVAVFVVVLLVTGRTDDDKPEQPRPTATVTSMG